MPYKNKQDKKAHNKRYWRRKYAELKQALGNKCIVCGTTNNLEVHHLNPVNSRSRNKKNCFNPEGKVLRCKEHHSHTETWRGKRRR